MKFGTNRGEPVKGQSSMAKLYRLLTKEDRKDILILFLVSLASAILQSTGIISLMPFINLVMNLDSIHENYWLKQVYDFGKFHTDMSFVFTVGIVVMVLLIVSSLLASITSWMKQRFILKRTYSLSQRLFEVYLYKPYSYFLQKNSSELAKNILTEINNLGNNYLSNLIELVISSFLFVTILATLLIVNVKTTLFIIVFFGVTYGLMTVIVRHKLVKTGELVVQFNKERFKAADEALGSIKITKSLNLELFFLNRYRKAALKFSNYQIFQRLISEIPNYLLEGFVFSGMIGAILILIWRGYAIQSFIPIISVYALAGYRIMPSLSRIFKAVTAIFHNQAILDKVYIDMFEKHQAAPTDYQEITGQFEEPVEEQTIVFDHAISLKQVHFQYQESDTIIDQMDLEVRKNELVGIAGTTGAGKTTLIDLFLGLLQPVRGGLYIDDIKVDGSNVRAWRSMIGYVPQDIYLLDDTIESNIAFGVHEKSIDHERVRRVAKIAAIDDYITSSLPQGYQTVVGERGVRLSGGQRQRIGLARSLYRDPEMLILDEATSALDGSTEEQVLSGIHQKSNVKTMLIIAHRLNTLKVCDRIIVLEKGRIIDSGTYDDLLKTCPQFIKMAKENHPKND